MLVHHHGHARDAALQTLHDLNRLQGAAALGDHVLDHQAALARADLEPAAQHQGAILLLREDEAATELTGHLLTDHQSPHGGCDDGLDAERTHLVGQGRPEALHQRHLLQRQRALEELAAVQAAAEDEVPLQQGTGLAEQGQCFLVGHAGREDARKGFGERGEIHAPGWTRLSGHFGAEGQRCRISQPPHSGDRAPQRRRPCQISQWLNRVQSDRGTHCWRSRSIFSG